MFNTALSIVMAATLVFLIFREYKNSGRPRIDYSRELMDYLSLQHKQLGLLTEQVRLLKKSVDELEQNKTNGKNCDFKNIQTLNSDKTVSVPLKRFFEENFTKDSPSMSELEETH